MLYLQACYIVCSPACQEFVGQNPQDLSAKGAEISIVANCGN